MSGSCLIDVHSLIDGSSSGDEANDVYIAKLALSIGRGMLNSV